MNHYELCAQTVVQFRNIETDSFCGTGFLVGDKINAEIKGNIVHRLVTNRHIAINDNLGVITNLKKPINDIHKALHDVKKFKFAWCYHANDKIDIATTVFSVSTKVEKGNQTDYLEKINFFPTDQFISISEINEGDEVFFLGFPIGIGSNHIIYKPIYRHGYIAFKDKNYFYIDGHSFPGNSGSPVYILKKYYDKKNNNLISEIKLAGIINANLSYSDICCSTQTGKARITFDENIGLCQAFSTDSIMECLKTVPKK